MKMFGAYPFESLLVGAATLLTIGGFWNIYFGSGSNPEPYHHLHVVTIFIWLTLLLCQLALIGNGNYSTHRRLGLSILVAAPLLVASATLLSVQSAQKGLFSGQGDFMIVQNVMGTLELALIIFLGFALRRRRQLHASFLVSTALLFMGIAMFFSLIGFVPGFKIEGPETFHRFGKALTTIQYACIAIGLLFFVKDPRSGWPFLLVGSTFSLNEFVKSLLAQRDLIQPLTEIVASVSKPLAFNTSFVFVFLLLAATGILKARPKRLA
ncbi:MAG: hypothetical protein H0W34_05770 [Pyrinomonadaceae bacterium]|nr:hypothetical protein [Chthoniobacterales bacterium]MBA3571472.1 hypothetical protein [Pyrinomonadaceae bacterium]